MLFDPSDFFKNKNILVGISGSIAIYKILDLLSTLKKAQANLRVIMSEESLKFITPLCFEAITHTRVLCAQTEDWSGDCNHIGYAQWADIFLIAPATANTIAKIANGIADNILLSTILASSAPKILAPAMNTQMLLAQSTKNNIKKLQDLNFTLIPTRQSLLACDTFGDGALAETSDILLTLAKNLSQNPFWKDKNVIITGGGSKENIDSVRCLSNHSSGLQASALAEALDILGAKVTFISSVFPTTLSNSIIKIPVKSAEDYHQKILESAKDIPTYLFMAAAIADFKPKTIYQGKIKKNNHTNLIVECIPNIDILKNITQKNIIKIGFKAESDEKNAKNYATSMLENKKCLCVCLNILTKDNTFGSQNNQMTLISQNKTKTLSLDTKSHIAFKIAEFIATLSQ